MQVEKKEIIGIKGQFYNNYDIQRRDIPSDGYPNTVIGNVSNSAIHSYGQTQLSAKHNTGNAKGRFSNSAMQDGYFQGYYGKQQSQEFYGKYDPEFGQAHPKPMSNPDQKPPEFHHIKADFHHAANVKTELSHPKLADFNHGKALTAANFHQGHQSFYNQPQQPQHGTSGGATQTHQVPIQYPNQYYPNDFDAPGIDQSYYEQRVTAAAGAQTNYYDGMYQTQAQIQQQQQQYDAYGAAPPGGQLQHDGCENYTAYPQQYFEGANPQLHATAAITNSHHATHGPHGQMHSGQVPQNFNHPPQTAYHAAQQHVNGLNGNAVAMGHHMDNSNSSSDFNFLSNIANDFVPEYYQLS